MEELYDIRFIPPKYLENYSMHFRVKVILASNREASIETPKVQKESKDADMLATFLDKFEKINPPIMSGELSAQQNKYSVRGNIDLYLGMIKHLTSPNKNALSQEAKLFAYRELAIVTNEFMRQRKFQEKADGEEIENLVKKEDIDLLESFSAKSLRKLKNTLDFLIAEEFILPPEYLELLKKLIKKAAQMPHFDVSKVRNLSALIY